MKKGFTLIELLAVIIILTLLALLTSGVVANIVKDSKDELYNSQLIMIENAAKIWSTDNKEKILEIGCKYIELEDLQNEGLIDREIKNPRTNEVLNPNATIITIVSSFDDNNNLLHEYEIITNFDSSNPGELSSCSNVFDTDETTDET